MNTYFLCLTQYVNVGDLLINKMLIDECCRYGYVYLDCPDAPEEFRRFLLQNKNVIDVNREHNFSVRSCRFFQFPIILKKCNITHFFQSPGPIRKKDSYVNRLFSKYIHYNLKHKSIRECKVGNCCSAIEARGDMININLSNEIYVRTISGVQYMKSLGFTNVNYIPDLAYLLSYQVSASVKNKIAILSFREIKSDKKLFMDWLIEVVDILIKNGYKIALYYQVKKDRNFMIELYNLIKREGVSLREDLLWYDSFNYYSDKTLVVSNRLHALLVGVVYNCIPFVYVDGNPLTKKINDVFASSLQNYDSYLSLTNEAYKIRELIVNKDNVCKQLQEDCLSNAKKCRSTIGSIKN